MSCEFEESAALYAINALDEQNFRSFGTHVDSCSKCQNSIAHMREVSGMLASSVSVEPPLNLRFAVMSQTRNSEQAGTLRDSVLPSQPRSPSRLVPYLGLVAGLVAFTMLSAVYLQNSRSSDFESLASVPDAVIFELEGSRGELTVAWSDERNKVAVLGNDLDDVDPGLAYELWIVTGEGVRPAGLFTTLNGEVDDAFDVGEVEPQGWGVSVEPKTGSPHPTTEVVFSKQI